MIIVTREDLNQAVTDVSGAVAARTTLPVLGNILLSAAPGGQLVVAATNLDIAILTQIPCKEVDDTVNITVPAPKLISIVGALPEGEITLKVHTKKQELTIIQGRYQTTLKGIDYEEFPQLPSFEAAVMEFSLPLAAFNAVAQAVLFTASTDQARPMLTGIDVSLTPQEDRAELAMQATDGYRLARLAWAVPLPRGLEQPVRVIVPAKHLTQFLRITKPLKDADLRVGIARTKLILEAGNDTRRFTFSSNLLEGQYPDLAAVMPRNLPVTLTIDNDTLAEALNLADIIAADMGHVVELRLSPTHQPPTIKLFAVSAEAGDTDNEVTAEAATGPAGFSIAFNAKYLIEAVKALTSNRLVLEVSSPTSPGVIRPAEVEAAVVDWRYVMMPMQTKPRTSE